jgi:hypothetical protein
MQRPYSLIVALGLAACSDNFDDKGDDLDGLYDPDADADADGTRAADDCDDGDADVHPDALERCNGVDDDCDGEVDEDAEDAPTWYADGDGDGYGDAATPVAACGRPHGFTDRADDCDDADPHVSPTGIEVCNGTDDDCDGDVDEDAVDPLIWYADADGDGFGDTTDWTRACEAPSGHVDTAGDCADDDDAISPDAQEICNGTDDDCDGRTDDADPDVDTSAGGTWYADTDADGFGDAAAPVAACAQPSDTSGDATDCDDTDPGIHPAAAEVCDGAVDEDCDGLVDDADDSVTGTSTWALDDDGDGYGDADAAVAACLQPSGTVADASDCDDADAGVNPAASEVCDGAVDEDCDGLVDDDDGDVDLSTGSTWYADADADGFGDASATTTACAAPAGYASDADDCDDTDASVSPDATEICGNGVDDDCDGTATGCSWSGTTSMAGAAAVLTGESTGGLAGWVVGPAGDHDGDGFDDLAVVANSQQGSTTCSSTAGAAYIVSGTVSGRLDLARADARIYPSATPCSFGDALAHGDANDDGYDDLIVADDPTGVAMLLGPLSGTTTSSAAGVRFTTDNANGGSQDVAVGDLTGDGIADVVVGAPATSIFAPAQGRAWLLAGPLTANAVLHSTATRIGGTSTHDQAGHRVDLADMDGDGQVDLVAAVKSADHGGTNGGSVAVLLGPVTAAASLSSADGLYTNGGTNDRMGDLAAAAGDLNGDGTTDLLAGCTGCGSYGELYVWFGPATAGGSSTSPDLEIRGEATAVVAQSASVGDLDGDGQDDLAVGVGNADITIRDAGVAAVFYGPLSGTHTLTAADVLFEGLRTDTGAGRSLAFVGDTDGDGTDDLLVGAWLDDTVGTNAGAAYLILGAGL